MRNMYKKDPRFMVNIKEFLSAGRSKSPKELFMDMGIDITDKSFWLKGLTEVEDTLKETQTLAKKLGKI